MADYSPKFTPGNDFTQTAGAAIVGGQLLVVSAANTVIASSASAANWLGVARFDAASGDKVTVTRGGVQRLVASGAINAGERVIPATAGKVATIAAGNVAHSVGTALTTVADGALVTVALDR